MASLLAICRRCGTAFTPERRPDRARAVLPTRWRLCPRCHDAPPPTGTVGIASTACEACGRPLRTGKRTICAPCLGVPS